MSPASQSPSETTRSPQNLLAKVKESTLKAGSTVKNGYDKITPEMRAAIFTSVVSVIVTLGTVVLTSPIIIQYWLRGSALHSKHTVLHCKVRVFQDRAVAASPVYHSMAGQPGSSLVAKVGVFDDTEYTFSYDFYPHREPFFGLEFHTSGLGEAHSVYPSNFTLGEDYEEYEKSNGKILSRQIDLKDDDGNFMEHVLTTARSVNGLQKKLNSDNYESDVGLHIRHETDVAEILVDFSSIDYEKDLAGEPKVYLVTSDHPRILLGSSFENGVVKAKVTRPPPKSAVVCDWRWSSEKAPVAQPRAVSK